MEPTFDRTLLQMESFPHEPLQAGFVDNVVGEFLVGEHSEGGALGPGHQFRGFFNSEIWVLADDRHHHVDHHLQATDLLRLLQAFVGLGILQGTLVSGNARGTRIAANQLDVVHPIGVATHSPQAADRSQLPVGALPW
jgi:hypothetical protein